MNCDPFFGIAPDDDSDLDELCRVDWILAIRLKSSLVADLGGGLLEVVDMLIDPDRARLLTGSSFLSAHEPLYDDELCKSYSLPSSGLRFSLRLFEELKNELLIELSR